MKKWVNLLIFLFTFSFELFTSLGCSSSTGPITSASGRRDYTWTVDTISYPGSYQTIMNAIWGSDTKNIFVAGHNDQGFGKMYHYDGKTWEPVILPTFTVPDFNSILGFNKNEIYVAGFLNYLVDGTSFIDSSIVIHYNGSTWEGSLLNQGRFLNSITGTKNNIYVAGGYKTFFHFNGIKWEKINLKFYIPDEYDFHYVSAILEKEDSSIVMLYYCSTSDATKKLYYYLTYKDSNCVKIDSFSNVANDNKWGSKLWESPNGNIYSVNPSLYKLNGSLWEKVLNDYNLYTAVNGTNENNIFLVGEKVLQYNGKDWYEFKDISSKYGLATSVCCFEKEVFIVFTDFKKTFIIKGELKN